MMKRILLAGAVLLTLTGYSAEPKPEWDKGGQSNGGAADNLLFNSGFDLDSCGYAVVRFLNPGRNQQLKYTMPVVNSDSPRSNGRSLNVPDPYAEHIRIFTREFRLAPDTDYCLSFSAKSERPQREIGITIQCFDGKSWAPLEYYSRSFPVGDRWTPCVFQFKTRPAPADGASRVFSLTFDFSGGAPGALALDGLRLAAGTEHPYTPAPGLELACRFPNHVLEAKNGVADADYELFAVNHSQTPVRGELVLTLAEDFSGNLPDDVFGVRREAGRQALSLAPGERKQIKGKIAIGKFGSFALLPEFRDEKNSHAAAFPGRCSVIAPFPARPVDPDREFCVGLNFAGAGFLPDGSFCTAYFNAADYERLYAAMGSRLLRDWDCTAPVFGLCNLESREEGRFDFQQADRVVDLALSNGMRVMPILGGTEFQTNSKDRPKWPGWLKDRCQSVDGKAWLPPMEVWRDYVNAVAVHFKGRVSHYEILNEPNLYLSAKNYVPYLKTAWETIKAADPKAKVVGICTTGDMGSGLSNFLDDCAAEGAMKFCDIVSFHPYNAPNLGWKELPADKLIEKLRARMTRYGCPNMPLWNTELYYMKGFGSGMDREATQPQDLAQRFLFDLGEGLGQSTSICASSLFRNVCTPHSFSAPYFWTFEYPVNFPVYNALARFFQGAEAVTKIRWDDGSICYVYLHDGVPAAAFWRYGKSETRLVLPPELREKFRFYDLYGNEFRPGETLEFDDKPCYLTPSSPLSAAEVVALLKTARVESPNPVQAEAARFVKTANGWQLSVALRNRLDTPLTGMVGVEAPGLRCLAMDLFSLPKGGGELCDAIKVDFRNRPHRGLRLLFTTEDGRSWKADLPAELPEQADYAVREAVFREDFSQAPSPESWKGDGKFLKILPCLKFQASNKRGTELVSCPLDIRKMRGRKIAIACQVKGVRLKEPTAAWLGPKIMFSYDFNGKRASYDMPKQFGTYDWTPKVFFVDVPREADNAAIALGIQDGVGEFYVRNLILKPVPE